METIERTATVPVEAATPFLRWTSVVAGAFVASATSVILIAFGSAIGLSIVSSAPTWRDTSPALTTLSGLYLLLTALVSFGLGGYVAGRVRERWSTTAHDDVVEFRDGIHGALAWAVAVVITGLVAAATAASVGSRAVPPASSPATSTAEPLLSYELDGLFRAERRSPQVDLTYSRAEAGRILLTAAGRQGITPDDRAYLAHLVASATGITQPEAERRLDIAITAATTAVHKARRSAVILAFSTAVALLAGAAAAWFGSCVGGRYRDEVSPSLIWRWPQHA
jgi:hypothetical protein